MISRLSVDDRLCRGIASGNLAVLLQRRGDLHGAEKYARQSVAALETGEPEYTAALVRPLLALAQAYLAEQRFAQAKAILVRLEHLPEATQRDRAFLTGARALIDAHDRRPQDAEQHYREAIQLWEEAGEGDTINALPELTNLALMYMEQRRLRDAAPLLDRAWSIANTSKEATNEQRLTAMTNLGVLYARQERWLAADELFRVALPIADEDKDIRPPTKRRLYENYAFVLRRSGRKREAKALQARADALLSTDTSSMTVDLPVAAKRRP